MRPLCRRAGEKAARPAIAAALALAASALAALKALALDYQFDGWQVNLNTILSEGLILRTSPPNKDFIYVGNGGRYPAAGGDHGTLNYRAGSLTFATSRITSELNVKRDDYGFFARATGFFDAINDTVRTDFQKLNRPAVRDVGADLRLLDAFAYARPYAFGHPFDVRIGSQVLNWGESTFIPNGINVITPLDITALHTPGTPLRDAFLGVPAIDVRTQLVGNLSAEGFYQVYWNRSRFDPAGDFFSTDQTISDGGQYILEGAGVPDRLTALNGTIDVLRNNVFGAAVPRSLDRHPSNQGQFGLALRYSVPSFNDAEFGLYFENYHSKLPFLSWRAGTRQALVANEAAIPRFSASGVPTYNASSSYFADYPSDIKLLGASYALTGPAGVAIQGEVSHRFNQPVQLAGADLGLAAQIPALCGAAADFAAIAALAVPLGRSCVGAIADPVTAASGGVPTYGSIITGWKRYGVSQFQTTLTKVFPGIPGTGVTGWTLIGEAGLVWVHGLSSQKGILNAVQVPYSTVSSVSAPSTAYPSKKGHATSVSGGYVVAATFDMPNTLPYGISMSPAISLSHSVAGRSPGGAGNFEEGNAAVSAGVNFGYVNKWTFGVQYTYNFSLFNTGRYNPLLDRDYVSAALTYAF